MSGEALRACSVGRHKLPIGPGSLGERFVQLCESFPDDFVAEMRLHVRTFLQRIAVITDPRYHENLRDACWVAENAQRLLDIFPQLPAEHKLLAVGAIRYFVVHADSFNDFSPGNGFHDDRLVMHHVLERLALSTE
jgi:hypothetical protein